MTAHGAKTMALRCGARWVDCSQPRIMGVLNVTPDSFSDGARYASLADALCAARGMIEEGADFIDIGGESTRPGATPVPLDVELQRVIPVLDALAGSNVVLSIDTYKSEVMDAAIRAGATLINDVKALRGPGALDVVARSDVAVCLMHAQGEPRTMQRAPVYRDVVTEVRDFLREREQACVASGIALERLVIDPGFGFGKTLEHNLALLRGLELFARNGGPVVLAGLSRKSMLQAMTGRDVAHRQAGSLALALLAVQGGARIIRTHDVAATRDVLRVYAAITTGT